MIYHREKNRAERERPRGHGIAVILTGLMLGLWVFEAGARELKFHGPVVQWHRDPTGAATLAWVERLAPDIPGAQVWREGRAPFGYGDGDDVTVIREMRGNHPRLYLAKEFVVNSLTPDEPLHLYIDYDDAFVAYLNGIEVARSQNLKHQYIDGDVKDGHEAGEPELFVIPNPAGLLKSGRNLLSVEGHNVRESSSDFTLDPVLMQGDEALIPPEDTWLYFAGGEPGSKWFRTMPNQSPYPELPKGEAAEWTVGIRARGSSVAYSGVDIESEAFGETDDLVYFAQMEGLQPGASYEYVLRADNVDVGEGWFTTAPAVNRSPIQFVVGGDMGTTTAIPVCKLAGRLDPMFALVGGDLAYANGRDTYKWFDWIDNWVEFVRGSGGRDIPMIMGIGNHEMKGLRIREKDAPFYFSFFDLPNGESNFTVDFADYLSVVLLDSNHAQRVKSQNFWLNLELAARKDRPHLFTIYHRPAWGTGMKRNVKDIQEHWSPLFEKYGVDCVFENDHHTYKRTHKITGGVRDDENGILYIGDGAWGARLRAITPEMLRKVGADRYLAEWGSVHHLVQVTANPDGSKLYEAISADGDVFDSYFDKTPATPQ
ncbi:MAG: metallophosphoesterase [Verrucomicrobiales bacterium]|nr:metallophosphoesterase [Verrucomicrobiales bacterium]